MTTNRTMFGQFISGSDTTKSIGLRSRASTTQAAKNTSATRVSAHPIWTSFSASWSRLVLGASV